MALIDFNANEVQPSQNELIPAGWYEAVITASDWSLTKDGSGRYLKLEFTLLDEKYRNRKVFIRLNLENQNREAVDIARADLSAICHAVGVLQPKDTVELHDIPLAVKVAIKQDRNKDTEPYNTIREYKPKNSMPKQSAASEEAPWKRRA